MAIIPYVDVLDHELLPIDAQDVVTKVRLVVAGNRAGAEPTSILARTQTLTTITYAPRPVTIEYEAPEHAVFGATRSFALPTGVDPFLPPTDPRIPEPFTSGFTNPGNPSAVRDGDPETYAEWDGNAAAVDGFRSIWYTASTDDADEALTLSRMVGFRLVWTLQGGTLLEDNGDILARAITTPPVHVATRVDAGWSSDWVGTRGVYRVSPCDAPTEAYGLLPGATHNLWWTDPAGLTNAFRSVWLQVHERADVASMRVHAFYPLVLDEERLLDIARAQVRLPAAVPRRVSVRGVVPPDREHTITGWPGGDYTGRVAQHQYDLGKTVIDFEQAGAPMGLPAEAMEAARERRTAIDATVRAAGYALKMGERQ